MPNQLKAYKIEKRGKVATIITSKLTYKDEEENYLNTIYTFYDLTDYEMDDFTKELRKNDIPYRLLSKPGGWEIQVKETEVDSFHVSEPEYESCTREQLIQLLIQKNIEIQNIKFQSDNLHKAYSRLYHLYEEAVQNSNLV